MVTNFFSLFRFFFRRKGKTESKRNGKKFALFRFFYQVIWIGWLLLFVLVLIESRSRASIRVFVCVHA